MMHSWHKALFGFVCCVLVATPALAQSDTPKGDPAVGQIKFNSCAGCHGIPEYKNAYPTYNVPRLGGQHYSYIVAALKEYASGKRKHSTMNAQASSLSEQDILDLAAFLSQPRP